MYKPEKEEYQNALWMFELVTFTTLQPQIFDSVRLNFMMVLKPAVIFWRIMSLMYTKGLFSFHQITKQVGRTRTEIVLMPHFTFPLSGLCLFGGLNNTNDV
jgi:hypothetical protein